VIVLSSLEEWRTFRAGLDGEIGFVPTMGALHAGHVYLLQRSREENDHTVLSIYVNPTQFNDPADLDSYPKTLNDDLCCAREFGVTAVLIPTYDQLYPEHFRFRVEEHEFSRELCGAHRDGHFTGVMTVVLKLLNLVKPNRAYFGEKDYQQYLLIRDMCEAFFVDVEIVPCATVREDDGLALSSRNALLDEMGRARAGRLNRLLREAQSDSVASYALEQAGFEVDYVVTRADRRFAAATLRCGDREVRLIDNVAIAQDG
jgi:pantoate--beta-alanine ligase